MSLTRVASDEKSFFDAESFCSKLERAPVAASLARGQRPVGLNSEGVEYLTAPRAAEPWVFSWAQGRARGQLIFLSAKKC